jgi:hypothetical protein
MGRGGGPGGGAAGSWGRRGSRGVERERCGASRGQPGRSYTALRACGWEHSWGQRLGSIGLCASPSSLRGARPAPAPAPARPRAARLGAALHRVLLAGRRAAGVLRRGWPRAASPGRVHAQPAGGSGGAQQTAWVGTLLLLQSPAWTQAGSGDGVPHGWATRGRPTPPCAAGRDGPAPSAPCRPARPPPLRPCFARRRCWRTAARVRP